VELVHIGEVPVDARGATPASRATARSERSLLLPLRSSSRIAATISSSRRRSSSQRGFRRQDRAPLLVLVPVLGAGSVRAEPRRRCDLPLAHVLLASTRAAVPCLPRRARASRTADRVPARDESEKRAGVLGVPMLGQQRSHPRGDGVGWPGGIAPPGSLGSGRDSLPSPGSSHQPVSTSGPIASGRIGRAVV
jgi:hypothetical protein